MSSLTSPELEAFRLEVRQFLRRHLPRNWNGFGSLGVADRDAFTREWREVLRMSGYLAPSWPREYGGAGLGLLEQVALSEELTMAGVPGFGYPTDYFGITLLGNTILKWGTEEQKRYHLPRILHAVERWCQGFSEPDAGSDLASLRTRATLRHGQWVLNGQKIWTSDATEANAIFVLARTNFDAPKHRSLSLFLVPMAQRGVEVQPVRTMSGVATFNQVFLTDARCPKSGVLGPVNAGWQVAMTLLEFERGEIAATPIRFQSEFDRLLSLFGTVRAHNDRVLRDKVARCYSELQILRFLSMRITSDWLQGTDSKTKTSLWKLIWSEYHREVTETAISMLQAHALLREGPTPMTHVQTDYPGAPNTAASWVGIFLNARAETIYAGTSEIQRNIVAEQVLGLPREPR